MRSVSAGHWTEQQIRQFETSPRTELDKPAHDLDARGPPNVIPEDDDIVLDTTLAARIVSLSRWSLCELIRTGKGPRVVKFTERKIGIRSGDLRSWIRSRMVPAE